MTQSPTPSPTRPTRSIITRVERLFTAGCLRILRVRRGRERVARGFALGLVINFLPTFGFGVVISGFVARAFGGHLGAGIVGGASLTFFWPLLFYLNARMGTFLLGLRDNLDAYDPADEKKMSVLIGSQAFAVGTAANMVIAGLTAYIVILLILLLARRSAIAYLRYRMRR